MSKFSALILVLKLFSFPLFSQKPNSTIYIKVHAGYSVLSPGSTKGRSSISPSLDTTFFKVGKKAFGEGLRASVGFGFILNDYINVGIDAEYLKGNSISVPITQTYEKTLVKSVTTIEHNLISVIPNITFKAVSKPAYHIYNRIGIIIGIAPDITENYTYENTDQEFRNIPGNITTITTSYDAEYTLKTAIGYQASIGAQVKISDHLRIFVEISAYRLSFNRMKFEETEKTRRVVNRLTVMSTDKSRNILYYSNEGLASKVRSGEQNAYLFSYTYPQDPIDINTITSNFGLFFRF